MSASQIEMLSTDLLLSQTHIYRNILSVIDIKKLSLFLKDKNDISGPSGFGNKRLLLIHIIQYIENFTDREMEKKLQENIAIKWFCDFSLSEKTPTYSTLCKFRTDIIEESNLNTFYQEIKRQVQESNLSDEIKKNLKLEKKNKINRLKLC